MGKRRVLATVILGLLAGLCAPAVSHAATALPPVLPAVQQWLPGDGGGFAWTGSGRVVVNTADAAALSDDAQTFASDLGSVPVVGGTLAAARPGDVFVGLGSTDAALGEEGYALTIAPVLQVGARTAKGAFWAGQTILQLLHQQTALPPGIVRDWPKYPVRAVLVDDGTRSFPTRWWFNQIRALSYLKVNEITFTVNRLGLTSAQQSQIVAYGLKYHVPVTPVQPMPSYMYVVSPPLPAEYTLADRAGHRVPGALDLANPRAVDLALNATATALPSFAGPAWHIGADEYPDADRHLNQLAEFPGLIDYAHQRYGPSGTPEDLFRDFVNRNDDLVRAAGKKLRMWGDDLFPSSEVGINSDITVQEWIAEPGRSTPAQVAANGNQLVNVDQDFLYYNEGAPGFPNTTPQRVWEQFSPGRFNGGDTLPGGDSDPHLAGIELVQWDFMGTDQAQLERDLIPLHQALAQRAWGSARQFPTWAQMQPVLAAIGLPPGYLPTPPAGVVTAATNTIRLPDGTVATYRIGDDGNVWGNSQSSPGGPFGAWAQLSTGGGFTGTPSAIRALNGTIGLYVRTTSGAVWGGAQSQPGGAFGGWGPLSAGGVAAGDPTVIYLDDVVAVYFVGADGYVYGANQFQPYGNFSGWVKLSPSGGYVGKPAVVRGRDHLISIYARTSGGTIAGTTQLSVQGPYGGWPQLGITPINAASDPTVVVNPANAVGIYVTGIDGNVWETKQTQFQGPFGAWNQLSTAGGFAGKPAAAQTSDGLTSVYVRAGSVVSGSSQQTVGGAFGSFSPVGDAGLTGDPTALLGPEDTVSLFVPGAGGTTLMSGQSLPHGTFGPWRQI